MFSTSTTNSENQEAKFKELETRYERGKKCEMEMKTDFSKILPTENGKEIECEDKKNASNDKSQDNTHFIVTTVTNQMQETYT